MIRAWLFLAMCCGIIYAPMVRAEEAVPPSTQSSKTFGLKVTPLEYRVTLQSGDEKKGFIDISNPTDQPLEVAMSVRGFRQVADNGALEFFDDEQIEAGVLLDLESFALPPGSALRMYFLLDSTKLPSGNVFAAIFFTTTQQSADEIAVQPAVRVGSLLSITNGTPKAAVADVTDVSVSWLQLGTISGSYRLKNNANPTTSTGFYPEATISLDPFRREMNQTASLLFAGRERSTDFRYDQTWPGVYRLTVAAGGATMSRYVVVLTPLVGIILAGIALLVGATVWRRRTTRKKPRARRAIRR